MDQATLQQGFEALRITLANVADLTDLNAQAGLPDKPIVVLVHGIGGNAKHWSDPAYDVNATWLFNTAALPTKSGIVTTSPGYTSQQVRSWCKVLSDQGFSYINFTQPNSQGIEPAAAVLEKILQSMETHVYAGTAGDAPPVIIICHSRGGLVTRVALDSLKKEAVPHLTKVITLNTPHTGSYMPKLSVDMTSEKPPLDLNQLRTSLVGEVLDAIVGNRTDAAAVLSDVNTQLAKYLPGAIGSASTGDDFQQLIPSSPIFQGVLANDQRLDGVTYYGFGGTNPAFVKLYVDLGPIHQELLNVFDGQALQAVLTTLDDPAQYGGLEELNNGDSSVAFPRSYWPSRFNADHYKFPICHMDALIDPNLQDTVIGLILGKDVTKLIAEAAAASKPSNEWLKDEVVAALHDAFLMGWTTMELKSRINVAVLDQQIESGCYNKKSNDQGKSATPVLDALLIVADGNRSDIAKAKNSNLILPQTMTDSIQLTSLWRSLYTRLAALHYKRLPVNKTEGTAYNYDPQASDKDWSFLKNIRDEITSFGIRPATPIGDDIGVTVVPLADFGLAEIARQAINCLALLFTDTGDSLIALDIAKYQRELGRALLPPPAPALPNPPTDPTAPVTAAPLPVSDTSLPISDTSDSDLFKADWNVGILKLNTLVVKLLEAWDGYLREQYFSGGEFKNNEIELVAYEAGRALASLSWSTTVQVEPLERLLKRLVTDEKDTLCYLDLLTMNDKPTTVAGWQLELEREIQEGWTDIFAKGDITRLQHQIVALSTTMDDAFYRLNPDIKPPSANSLMQPNPDLPSQSILAIRHSLDYWQRTVSMIIEAQTPQMDAQESQKQGTLVLPQDFLWSAKLRSSMIKQSSVWQSLMTYEQNLRSFSTESAAEKIISDLMADFESAITQGFKWTWSFRLGVVAAIIVLIAIMAAIGALIISGVSDPSKGQNSIAGAIAALGTIIGGAFVIRSSLSSSATAAPGIGGWAESALSDALKRGSDQIRIEFAYLDYNISVAYPLIEFFIVNEIEIIMDASKARKGQPARSSRRILQRIRPPKPAGFVSLPIQNGYLFVVNVIWTHQDRDNEIKNVARAAFGPIGLLISARLLDSQHQGTAPDARTPQVPEHTQTPKDNKRNKRGAA